MKLPVTLTRLITLVAATGIADTLTMASAVVSLPFFRCSHVRKATIHLAKNLQPSECLKLST